MVFYPQINKQIEKINQKLEQYLRIFINHRQEQQLDLLGMTELIYNNKVHLSIKISLFKVNYRQDFRMELKLKKKRKYKKVEKFVIKIKEIQKKAKIILEKTQKEIKKYADRKRGEVNEYKTW